MSASTLLQEVAKYKSETADLGQMHIPVNEENDIWMTLLTGDISEEEVEQISFFPVSSEADLSKRVGIMSKTEKKNVEYGYVVGIALVTRYAVMAGADEITSFRLSDILLQKISNLRDIDDMRSLFKDGLFAFRELVSQANSTGRNSRYVEMVKDYIATHIFEKITLSDIASYIGLNPSYLSRIFSKEMGTTIKNYIIEEKIKRSCNLLVYSGKPISEISEYVGMSPQSYYTRMFTKVMGITPGKYKANNLNKNFLTSKK